MSSAFRNAEAAVVIERAALLGTSRVHTLPGVDLVKLWGNLAVAQEGAMRGSIIGNDKTDR